MFPPTRLVGFKVKDESVGAAGAACGVKRRDDDQLPTTPAEFAAFAVSLQSSVSGWVGWESFAGLTRLGVPGVEGDEPDVTVKVVERVVS